MDTIVNIATNIAPLKMLLSVTHTEHITKKVPLYTNSSDIFLEIFMAAIKAKMKKLSDGLWACTDCTYQTKYSTTLTRHVESKHLETAGFQCNVCQQFCPTRNSLMSHQYRKHDIRYSSM